MAPRVQDFVYNLTQSKAADLLKAYNELPAEKRTWSAGGNARTAADMVAEIAILNDHTADTLKTGQFDSNYDFAAYAERKNALVADHDALTKAYEEGLAAILAAIKEFPDDRFEEVVQFPWGPMKQLDIISYPFWNMGYHEGQVTFIAMMNEPAKV